MTNTELAQLFEETADMLELVNANPFKVRAYRRAAQVVAGLTESVKELYEAGAAKSVPGLGAGMEERIGEALKEGDFSEHRRLLEKLSPKLLELSRLEGVGPASVKLFYQELGIDSVEDLEKACLEGKIRSLPRMGEKKEATILHAIENYRRFQGRFLISQVEDTVQWLEGVLLETPGVDQAAAAGSYRRRRETIGDLDVLVSSSDPGLVTERFSTLPEVRHIVVRGPTKVSVQLGRGLQVDLRVVDPSTFGAALHYFTGSKAHNVVIRNRARRVGLKVSEYGVFRGTERLGGRTEEEVFNLLDLPWIPPELREAAGEFEAAEAGKLPNLVSEADLKGDLHMHTEASDGHDSVRGMVKAAIARGHQYLAITDHSHNLAIAGGLDAQRLAEQGEEIDRLRQEFGGQIVILKGIETDILPDGSLDLGNRTLGKLDCVVASVHSRFQMDRLEMTRRIVNAMRSGVMDILGHPTGVLLTRRQPYQLDMDRVLEAAAETGVMMELNCHPDRLDMDSVNCRKAREAGVPVVINSDAHDRANMELLRYGVGVARRGWLEESNVANCHDWHGFRRLLARHHPHLQ